MTNPLFITAREADVWRFITLGYQVKEAKDVLGCSRQTLEKHRYNLYRKLGVESKLEAALLAVAYGVVSVEARGPLRVRTTRARRAKPANPLPRPL